MRYPDTSKSDTMNAIAALLEGFRTGRQGALENRRKEAELESLDAYRQASINAMNQERPPISGDIMNQAFQQVGIANPNLPSEIPLQSGNTYGNLIGQLRSVREAAESNKHEKAMLDSIRKGFREREKDINSKLIALLKDYAIAHTDLLKDPNNPKAIGALNGIKSQINYQKQILNSIRQRAAELKLPEYQALPPEEPFTGLPEDNLRDILTTNPVITDQNKQTLDMLLQQMGR